MTRKTFGGLPWPAWLGLPVLMVLMGLPGCGSFDKARTYGPQEKFASGETFSRLCDAPPAKVCRSARLALLSQGYLVTTNETSLVEGKKNFQPDASSHVEVVIRVVCVPDAPDGSISMAFAAAVQDTYTVRRVTNSASLGVGAIGSVSLPFGESSEGLSKVGSQTIASADFYDKLFALIKGHVGEGEPPPGS